MIIKEWYGRKFKMIIWNLFPKKNAHDDEIYTLSKLENGLILSGSKDNSFKIW